MVWNLRIQPNVCTVIRKVFNSNEERERGKGERGKGTSNLKALVSNMDTDFYRTTCLKNLLFCSPYLKTGALYLVGKSSKFCALSPFPLPLFPFLVMVIVAIAEFFS